MEERIELNSFSDEGAVRTDALEVLGNDVRVRILRELAETNDPLTFTELRKAADVQDSGRFNYHLTKLCEYFVRETPDGYELGHAGSRIVAMSQAANHAESTEPVEPVEECPVCGETDCEKLFHVHLDPRSFSVF